jgi:hypothetical protein
VLALLAANALPAQQPQEERVIQDFTYRKFTDPMTDADRSVIMVPGLRDGARLKGYSPLLVWRCGERDWISGPYGLNVNYEWNTQFAATADSMPVQVRFDRDTPFVVIAKRQGIGVLMPPNRVAAFTDRALRAGTVTFRVVGDDGDSKLTDSFGLHGLAQAFKLLRCKSEEER